MRNRNGSRFHSVLLTLLPVLIVLPFFIAPASGQQGLLIQKTWGNVGDQLGRRVAVDAFGNTYMTGTGPVTVVNGTMPYAAFLLKYDSTGNIVWEKSVGVPSNLISDVAVDSSGSIYMSSGGFLNLMKFDSSGGLIWHKTWSYLFDAGIAVDSSGNIYSAGETSSFGNGNYDVFLAKVNASGNMIWQKTWGGSFNDFVSDWTNGDREFGHGVGVDSSGNIYVTGATFSFGAGSSDVFLLKFNSTGALLFQKTWGGSGEDIGRDLAVDSSGNIYLTGDTASFGAGDWDVFLLKFNSAGNLQFQKTWGGAGRDGGSGVAVDSTGNVYVTGDTTSFGTGNQDAFLLKFDSTGGLSSQKTWGGSNADWGSDVDVDNLGNPVVTGYVSESSPYTLGSSGNVTLGIPTFILNNVAGNNLGTPVFPTYSAADFIASALGSESYVGGFDAFLLKYGALPMVTFQTNPSIGTIVFNGTIYMNGQNGNYTYGNATATASLLPGYIFTSWTTTGNIVAATPTSNSTTVIISGPGTLKANFTPLQTTPITPLTLIASVLSTSVLLILRRRRDR